MFKTADVADQPYADDHGICVDSQACSDIAGNYPGGAYCHTAGD